MAVMRNSIIFGGVDSADFGIYISGEGVFNAPKRAVEYIQVPGRNGAFALDQGYYENIEVTYPGFNYEPNMADFCDQLAGFRNAICSQKGYQRLSDTFHPNEYRMAVYSEGLEIEPMKYNTASNFKMKFNCKPQRYLTSGETELTVTSGQTINNPTLFDSSPLLAVKGYGTIQFNGYTIKLQNAQLGDLPLWDESTGRSIEFTKSESFPSGILNSGDYITISPFVIKGIVRAGANNPISNPTATATHSGVGDVTTSTTAKLVNTYTAEFSVNVAFPQIQFAYGTPITYTDIETLTYSYTVSGSSQSDARDMKSQIAYDGANNVTFSVSEGGTTTFSIGLYEYTIPKGTGYSTESLLGDPTYIDCDLGEVYMIKDGSYIGLNGYIDLGSDLPTLGAGNNTVTFSNTVTQLKLTPRWWIL